MPSRAEPGEQNAFVLVTIAKQAANSTSSGAWQIAFE